MCVYVQLFVYVQCASSLDVNQNTGQLEIFTNGRHWKIDVLCDNIWSFGWVAYNRQTTVIIIICYVVFIAFNINHSSILPLMALNSLYYADVPLSNYSLTHPLSVDCGQLSCLIRCRTLEWLTVIFDEEEQQSSLNFAVPYRQCLTCLIGHWEGHPDLKTPDPVISKVVCFLQLMKVKEN